MAKTFAAQLEAFRDKSVAQIEAVLSASVQDVVEEAQRPKAQGGRMPVDTAFLRNSLVSELNGAQMGQGAESYALTAEAMGIGDIARFAWTAAYAKRLHFGFVGEDSMGRTYNQQGNYWIDGAAAEWQQTVSKNVERLK